MLTAEELHERIGELVNASSVAGVLHGLGWWLRGLADTVEGVAPGSGDIAREQRALAKRLIAEATHYQTL